VTDLYYPLRSLREGHWFKLICGASFQHLPAIRTLVMAYTLAGADCIDVAADPAVILTAKTALKLAADLAASDDRGRSYIQGLPWLMVSLNDGEDPHFRKAEFDASACPPDCVRPCESICPAQAIVFEASTTNSAFESSAMLRGVAVESNGITRKTVSGVLVDRCYGCGRCLPICPVQQITPRSYVSTPAAIAPLILQTGIDAIEIHTQIGHLDEFRRLWAAIEPWVCNLKLIAISCPDGEGLLDYLWALYDIVSPLPCPLIWQMDGRPMSGDIGAGATRAAVKLGQKVLTAALPGYIQLAGGTNHHTVPKLNALSLLHPQLLNPSTTSPAISIKQSDALSKSCQSSYIAGVAYGSYARTLLLPILNQLDAIANQVAEAERGAIATMPLRSTTASPSSRLDSLQGTGRPQPLGLEETPDLLWQAVALARSLVAQLKVFNSQRTRLNL